MILLHKEAIAQQNHDPVELNYDFVAQGADCTTKL